ncbi:histone acetyltransferase subunit NuA4-domain-containing protein [Alternaria rosae]|uniref:histone acetyltransferase subunit NuA4-domain-containing protein n=1 Tax=Alternaria rosae TaxID=1187941 RepID=UPI001E8E46FE|nr:histone acetyltransferase subunit NuA4-domain-containing protein [Alternaria rosae]KAH6878957.1 histone acetyltransferase subunit NuA4-domain-containing protein [Alternaria rosae]
MSENAAPGSANNTGADSSRGMPYYERLRRDLRESLNKKRLIDNSLLQLEDNILRVETQYLEETSAGNIIKGFDNYIKGAATTTTAGGAGTATRRKAPISDADRIFSRSSTSFLRESSTPGSATPSHAPTPTSSFPTRESSQPTNGARPGGSKKKKAADDEDEDGNKTKRQKISYGRE